LSVPCRSPLELLQATGTHRLEVRAVIGGPFRRALVPIDGNGVTERSAWLLAVQALAPHAAFPASKAIRGSGCRDAPPGRLPGLGIAQG
jgi:hypothetical protein